MCVEKNATLGGTCLNVGCIPSKVTREHLGFLLIISNSPCYGFSHLAKGNVLLKKDIGMSCGLDVKVHVY